jgi:hypothetical protein
LEILTLIDKKNNKNSKQRIKIYQQTENNNDMSNFQGNKKYQTESSKIGRF